MAATASEVEMADWQADGYPMRISYTSTVMEELRIAVTDGFNRLSHGGIEVGGVLFGIKEQDDIKILAQRPLVCQYAFGPSFTLSDSDGRALEDLLVTPDKDAELFGMRPLGWYHSHTRSEILLSERDLQLFGRYFPEPWQIALVLRPHRYEPVRAGFFFREPDGSIHAGSTRREFLVQPAGAREASRLDHDEAPTQSETSVTAPADPAAPPFPILPSPATAVFRIPRDGNGERELWNRTPALGTRSRAHWLLGAACIALTFAAILFYMGRSRPGLSLHALDVGGQLRVDWNCNAGVIQQSDGGALEIEDGTFKVHNELSAEQLRTGSITYMRTTGNVLVRLLVRVANQGTLSESTRFLGLPVEMPAAAQTDPAGPASEIGGKPAVSDQPESEELTPLVPKSDERSNKKEHEVRARAATPQNTPPVSVRTLRLPVVPASTLRNSPESLPSPPSATTAVSAPVIASLVPRLPAPVPAKAAHQGPASGRIIWTGKLGRRGTLRILENRASEGHLIGGLPGVPVRVQIFPAELTPQGLQLFAANPKSIGAAEAPGAQNAWNRTVYVYNPRQAAGISILEAPSPQNSWNRLVLRADRGEHSIIVLHWTLDSAETAAHVAADR